MESLLEGFRAACGFCMGSARRWQNILTCILWTELRRVWRTLPPRYFPADRAMGFKRLADLTRGRLRKSVAWSPRRKSIPTDSDEDHTVRTRWDLPDSSG